MSAIAGGYPIGRIEIIGCFAVFIYHCLASMWLASNSSHNLDIWLHSNIAPSEYVNGAKYDQSDIEWFLHKTVLLKLIILFSIHSVVFRASHYFYALAQNLTRIALIVFWSAITIYITSIECFSIVIIHATATIIISTYLRKEILAWISCISFVVYASKYMYFSPEIENFYVEYTFYLYTAIQILNVCIYLCRNPTTALDLPLVLSAYEYLLYPMYSMTLIVLFDDFKKQVELVRQRAQEGSVWQGEVNQKFLIIRAARLFATFVLVEVFLHMIHATAIMISPFSVLEGLNGYEIASVAYMSGQFFYLKYVVIFGMPSFFALVDGMSPPGPPVCISRVSKYSQMWRYFDRGLYEFLKRQVYIPVMGEAKGIKLELRRFGAMVGVFVFVLTWHGFKSNYLMWVCLSAFEIMMERAGAFISNTKPWKDFERAVGPAWALRVTAVAMDLTIVPGLLGVFYFLAQVGTGDEIMKRLLIDGFAGLYNGEAGWGTPGGVVIHMLTLGYFYNHCCLYLEHVNHPRLQKVKTE
uniref:MBOAT family protein n=1 Tax=Panagrellus redivivus TaxID=6233 RepID=A0A7E4VK79_PANRE